MSRRSSRSSISDGELILDCKAAYREVLDDIRKDITSKSVLLQALQETGRNPTERVLKKYWRSDTEGLSFDDFVDICRKEPVTSEEEIMKAFRKIDTNGDGFLSLEELFKIMTSKGEKMTRQEVREIIDEVDENGDGKLDFKERKFYYEQFCNMNKNTADQLRQQNRKRLERMERGDRKSKKSENFSDSKRGDAASMGSQISVKSNSSQRTSDSKRMGSSSSLRSDSTLKAAEHRRREDDEEEIDEDVDDEEEVIPTSARRRSSASKSDLSSSYKSRHKSSGELTHGSHASLRSAGMSGSRRSLLSVGEKDPNSTPVPAQRKTLSRSLLAEDDMPRPSPRSNKKGQSVKHVPASKLGHLADEPKNKRDWAHTSSKGCFFIDDDDGLMTHTYRLNLTEKSKVWITIQPTTTKKMIIGDTTPIDTMLLIARKRPDSEGRSVVGFTEKRDGKGKYGVMCELKAGTYNILPFTTGCHLRARHSDSSTETPLVRKDKDGKTAITKAFKKALQEIFELCDLDNNGCLSRDEFTWFTMRTSGDKVTDDEWDVVEETVELENGEITEAGFVKLNEMEADDVDDDISDLWVTLQSMGYNKDLFIDEACPFKLDVFAEGCDDAEVGLTCTGIETINNDMIIETVLEQDEGVKIKGMRDLNMYTYANDTRSTVVLDNRSNSRVKMTMDCTSSKNCKINQSHEDYNITLDPHEKQIAHHMMPMDETLDWTPRCVEAITK
ncbi:EF-hand calcium-binding domain-containing protein 7-like isoform X13 [Mizuhopecten yessoensis]|uniref:EF-hand calcium-binding domain-containing protein 7-like isoform X13 n=1 Tax=Mizuhopecten yessoensis TaxID=6573 RepID=UPI000B45B916|nr:EF-hand calcium-binding domain-containing protein 7-like isoform X13 [Mizuhopecten yessoensis]